MSKSRREVPYLVVFTDITRATFQFERTPDAEAADTLDAHYELVADAVAKAGGTLVKFIGDGSLSVFPEDKIDHGIRALLELKHKVDALLAKRGWSESRLQVRAHFGVVIAGTYGAKESKQFDILGKVTNTAARMRGTGVTLSVAVFRKLSPELRKHFKKSTPPVTYIRVNDAHRWQLLPKV